MCFQHRHGIFLFFLAVLPLQSENMSLAAKKWSKVGFVGTTLVLEIESPLFDLILVGLSLKLSHFKGK